MEQDFFNSKREDGDSHADMNSMETAVQSLRDAISLQNRQLLH